MLSESQLNKILKPIGIAKFNGNSVKVLVTDGSLKGRNKAMDSAMMLLRGHSPVLKKDKPGFSSIGYISVEKWRIAFKPASKQGGSSAGVENEKALVDSINNIIKKTGGALDVIFIDKKGKKFKVTDAIKVVQVGADTAGRKKADVLINTESGKSIPVSLKKDNAEYWESADSLFGKEAASILDKALKANKVRLEPIADMNEVYKLVPEVKIAATPSEKNDTVFGSDLLRDKGCVIQRTFSNSDFVYDKGIITIQVSFIAQKPSDITGDHDVVFLLRNDKSRTSKNLKISGIRILASYPARAKNALLIPR